MVFAPIQIMDIEYCQYLNKPQDHNQDDKGKAKLPELDKSNTGDLQEIRSNWGVLGHRNMLIYTHGAKGLAFYFF